MNQPKGVVVQSRRRMPGPPLSFLLFGRREVDEQGRKARLLQMFGDKAVARAQAAMVGPECKVGFYGLGR